MTLADFFDRWASWVPIRARATFTADLLLVVTAEQARERRRLCTDRRLYEQACVRTAEEIEAHRTAGGRDEGLALPAG